MSSSSPSDAPTSRSDLDAGNTTKQSDLSPPLEHNLNLEDFEQAGKQLLSSKAWAYYRSAADFERAYESNMAAWSKVTLRPRVLRGVSLYILWCRNMRRHSTQASLDTTSARPS